MIRALLGSHHTPVETTRTISCKTYSQMGRHKRKRFTPNILSEEIVHDPQRSRDVEVGASTQGESVPKRTRTGEVGVTSHVRSHCVVPDDGNPGQSIEVADASTGAIENPRSQASAQKPLEARLEYPQHAQSVSKAERSNNVSERKYGHMNSGISKEPPPVLPSLVMKRSEAQEQQSDQYITSPTPRGSRNGSGIPPALPIQYLCAESKVTSRKCVACGSYAFPHTDVLGTCCYECGHSDTKAARGPLMHSYSEVSSGWGQHAFHADKRMVYGHVTWSQRCELDESRFVASVVNLLACTRVSSSRTHVERAVDLIAYVRELQRRVITAPEVYHHSLEPSFGKKVAANTVSYKEVPDSNSANKGHKSAQSVGTKKRYVDRSKNFLTACVYMSLLREHMPVTLQMIATAANLPVHKVGAAYKRISLLVKSTSNAVLHDSNFDTLFSTPKADTHPSTRTAAHCSLDAVHVPNRNTGDIVIDNDEDTDKVSDVNSQKVNSGAQDIDEGPSRESNNGRSPGGVGLVVQKASMESLVEGRISELYRNRLFHRLGFEGCETSGRETYTHMENVSAVLNRIERDTKLFLKVARVSGVTERRRVNSVLTVSLAMAIFSEVQRQIALLRHRIDKGVQGHEDSTLGDQTIREADKSLGISIQKLTYYQVLELVCAGSDEMAATRKSTDQRALKTTSREMHGVLLKFNNEMAASAAEDVDCGVHTTTTYTAPQRNIAKASLETGSLSVVSASAENLSEESRSSCGIRPKSATKTTKRRKKRDPITFGNTCALTAAEVRKQSAVLAERYLRHLQRL